MKRLLSALLALCLVLTILPTMAFAAETASGTCGENVTWALDDAGILTISGSGDMEDFDSNGPPWAEYAADITAVSIADGITSIGGYAFQNCAQLTEVVLPDSISYIGSCAFGYCANLTSVNIPDGVASISYGLFFECDSLTGVELPDSVVNIQDNAFYGCDALASMVIPENVESIGQSCFESCTALTEFIIPDNVTTLGRYAFCGCTALEQVTLSSQITKLDEHAFTRCTALKNIVIPASVTVVSGWAFSSCGTIDSVKFMDDAPRISTTAFMETTATCYYPAGNDTWTEDKLENYEGTLTWVSYEPEIVTDGTCGESVTWHYDKATATLTISGTGAMEEYSNRSLPYWSEEEYPIEKVVVESGVTRIGGFAFGGIQTLKEAVLPDTVESIGQQAFVQCANLTTVNLPQDLVTIEDFVFTECTSLTGIELPDGIEYIGEYAFSDCGAITSITIPGSVKKLPEYSFGRCVSLTELNFEEGFEVIGDGAFVGCSALASVVFPESLTSIGFESFFECSALEELYFRGDAPIIHDSAFAELIATAYYPAGNSTWTADMMQNYGGTITWVAKNYNVDRISGSGRCETALAAADELKEILGVDTFDTIIIASGDKFADALTGSYLAAKESAPILLFSKGYEDELAAYVAENLTGGGKVYILGGTSSVPETVVDALVGYDLERLAGDTRFETNLKILEEAGSEGEEILVCTAFNFADSLSASAVGKPILLVDKALTEGQKDFVSGSSSFAIIGGINSVNEAIENELAAIGQVTRISGASREETSVAVARKYFATPEYAVLAYSRNFPDGLCGGPLAFALGAPLLLTNSGAEKAAADFTAEKGIAKGLILGGPNSISDATANLVFSAN